MMSSASQVIQAASEIHISSPAETTIRKQDYIIIERGTINQLLEGFYSQTRLVCSYRLF